MKTTVAALMYSGGTNPERQLTEEELTHLNLLTSQLHLKITEVHHVFGFSGFVAFASDEAGKSNWGVYGLFNGCAQVWDEMSQNWISYRDTAGICAYLFTLMNDTLQNHYINGEETMKKYMEQVIDDFTCV